MSDELSGFESEHNGEEKTEFESDFEKLAHGEFDTPHMKFSSYGILTFWILPFLYGGLLLVSIPSELILFWIPFLVIAGVYPIKYDKDIPKLSNFIYRFALVTFGAKIEKRDVYQIRLWWFLLATPILTFWLILLLIYTAATIIPILVIIWKRKAFLRIFFKLTFLPRGDHISFYSEEDLATRKEYHETVLQQSSEYYQFYRPKRLSKFIAYVSIVVITFILGFLIYPTIIAANFLSFNDASYGAISFNALIFLTVGLLGIIPYIILSGPIKRLRVPRRAASGLSKSLLIKVSSSFMNLLPMFKGEYYVEKNSRVLDMRSDFSFFDIFRRGRLLTIIFIPLVLISFVLGRAVNRAGAEIDAKQQVADANPDIEFEFTASDFVEEFFAQIDLQDNPEVGLFLILVGPVLMSIIIPMIFALSDAEIKRAVWEFDEDIGLSEEIESVEDFGQTLNNQFKLFLGIGTITSIFFNISRLSIDDTLSPITATAFILLAGATITLPGAFFMVYRYLSSGDHAYAVNSLRYHISKHQEFGVGTIVRSYHKDASLKDPPDHIRDELGLSLINPKEKLNLRIPDI